MLIDMKSKSRWLELQGVDKNAAYLSDEEVKELFEQYKRDGSAQILDKLYKNYYRLTLSIVSKYAEKVPYLQDDLLGVGLLALARSLNRLKHIQHNNVTAHVVVWVKRLIHTFVLEEQNKLMSRDTILKRKEEDCEIRLRNESDCRVSLQQRPQKHNRFNLLDEYDQLNWIINQESRLERKRLKHEIVKLRRQNYTDQEIADILNISKTKIHALRKEIMEEWQRLQND